MDRDFTFIHAADLHLDSPLRGLSRYEGAPAERLREATREALRALVERTIDERAACLLIAGDVFDGDWRDFNTGLFFAAEMARLRDADIPVVLLHGNHDAESPITRELTLPDNVHVLPAEAAGTVDLPEHGIAIHGRSFPHARVTEDLVPGYPPPSPGRLNIGMLHTALEGDSQHASYAPCSLAQLQGQGYDYWALGHVHRFQTLSHEPWVVFPGNLQGRHVREAGARGAVRVRVADGGVSAVEHLPLDVVRWAVLAVDLSGAADWAEVAARVRAAVAEAVEDAAGRLLAARIVLQGEAPIHGELTRQHDRLVADARAQAATVGAERAWIERVVVATSAPAQPPSADALGALSELLEAGVSDPDLHQALADELRTLRDGLPAELRHDPPEGALAELLAGDLEAVARAGAQQLRDRLGEGQEG